MKIKGIKARKILNSKGELTIEIEVDGFRASIGNGTSVGKFEVVALPPDLDKLVELVNHKLNKELGGLSINSFDDLDKIERAIKTIDASSNFKEIGGNILVNLELALLKAASENNVWKFLDPKVKKMPIPIGNIVGGGKHSGANCPDIQEFLIIPKTKDIFEAVFVNAKFHELIKDDIIKRDKNFNFGRNIEGAWCPNLNNYEVLDMLNKFRERIEKEFKVKVSLGIDLAASGLWNGRKYQYRNYSRFRQKRVLSREDQIGFVKKLIANYDLKYVEDPLQEEDIEGFKELKGDCMIVGDDLIATNLDRIRLAQEAINGVIIKPNQIGSLLKAKAVVDFAKSKKMKIIVSHRSGETEDNVLAHLAVGWEADYIKTGIVGGERTSKLNELLRISENL